MRVCPFMLILLARLAHKRGAVVRGEFASRTREDGSVSKIRQPESDEVLEDLKTELPVLCEAIEAGTQRAREVFEEENREVDRVCAPHIVRSMAKHVLKNSGHRVEDVDPEKLANNGLLYHCGRYSIRVLKARQEGILPVPGPSERRQEFFNQKPTQGRILGWEAAVGEATGKITHLVVCWDVDHEYELAELYLAMPKAGSATKTSVESEWILSLDPIGLSGTRRDVNGGASQEDEDDLPIRRKDSRESGSEQAG